MYQTLDNTEETQEMEASTNRIEAEPPNKKGKPPLIVFAEKINKHSENIESLKEVIKSGFHLIHNQKETTLFIHTHEDYEEFVNVAKMEGIKFHTYQSKGCKKHTFVLARLDSASTSDEITTWLRNRNVSVEKII